MTKTIILAAFAAVVISSCGNGAPRASLKTPVDTLSYQIGLVQSNGVKMYLSQQLGVDTAYLADFIKGVTDGAMAGDNKKKAAYYAGVQIGQQMGTQLLKGVNFQVYGEDSTKTISLKNLLAGFISGTTGKNMLFEYDEAFREAQRRLEDLKTTELLAKYGENKKAGEAFIAKKAQQADVKKLPGGTLYRVIKEGTGAIPTDTTRIQLQYEGRTIDGHVFDASRKNNDGKPVELQPRDMIPGWTQALTHMPVGSTWELYIPQDQAYGNREAVGGQIKPFSALIFTVEVVGLK